MTLDLLLAIAVVIALNAYVLAGGADFGGGVWDLLAHGGRARAQRELITHAIGPIWEANHVWLILAIVLLFVCFPLAFARLAIARIDLIGDVSAVLAEHKVAIGSIGTQRVGKDSVRADFSIRSRSPQSLLAAMEAIEQIPGVDIVSTSQAD